MKSVGLKTLLLLACVSGYVHCVSCYAQTPLQIISTVTQKFAKVNDYSADVNVAIDIPFIKADAVSAKVFYKRPNKFKVKSTGILVMPKQNANMIFSMLADTNSYMAVKTGEELLNGVNTQIINIIPNADTSDLILGKFWIDAARGLILKNQITTKTNGTLLIENTFGAQAQYALPDQMKFTVEVGKFKLPKALAADLNKTPTPDQQGDGKGRITLSFSNYTVNKGVSEEVFK